MCGMTRLKNTTLGRADNFEEPMWLSWVTESMFIEDNPPCTYGKLYILEA
jgi:hypothetical protein